MTDTPPPPKRPRGRPPGIPNPNAGRPRLGRTERMTIRVIPGTRAKFDEVRKLLNISLAETIERAAEKILQEIKK